MDITLPCRSVVMLNSLDSPLFFSMAGIFSKSPNSSGDLYLFQFLLTYHDDSSLP